MTPLSEYLEATEPTRRERAENWRVAIGLQKVDGLEVSPYLIETARRNVEGDIARDIAALKASNRLRRIGPDKGGRWEIFT